MTKEQKSAAPEVKAEVVAKLVGDQVIIGVKSPLQAGTEYEVSADIAMNLIRKGIAKLKK